MVFKASHKLKESMSFKRISGRGRDESERHISLRFIAKAARFQVLRTLTLKVSMVPSSSWTRQSRSGFGMSVTTVTPASLFKTNTPPSPHCWEGTWTHTHIYITTRVSDVSKLLSFQWRRLIWDDTALWLIHAAGCRFSLKWVMHCECKGVTDCV